MAGGWSKDGAVQEQIDASVEDAVKQARQHLAAARPSLAECEECGDPIPEARRRAIPGVRRCIPCQEEQESRDADLSLFNRRGSKDSQLR